jgi:uridine kinase
MEEKSKVYIGLTGEIGSGKGTFVTFLKELLSERTIVHQRFSDLLRETLALWSLPATRKNLQDVAIAMEHQFGDGTIANGAKQYALRTEADIVIIDGVRWLPDEKMIRGFPKGILVYITAPDRIRFERRKSANEKINEGNTTWERFEEEAKAENERYIPDIGNRADFKIVNDGTLEAYRDKVKDFVEQCLN